MLYLYQSYSRGEITEEQIRLIVIPFFLFVILLFFRNFWNWIMKRNYRSKYRRLSKERLEFVPKIDRLKINQTKLLSEKDALNRTIRSLKQKQSAIHKDFKQKEIELEEKRLKEKERYEKKIDDFKYERIFYEKSLKQTEVKASNTRLSAHFLKNVLLKVQQAYNEQQINKVKVFGNLFFIEKQKNELLPIDVLTKINQLLDYNVSTIKSLKVSLNEEVKNVLLFLDIVQFLKPNLKIKHHFKKNYKLDISPTLFFPFIENALKHGDLNSKDSFLIIDLIIIKNTLLYRVTNSSFNIKNKKFEKGFGLNSLEKALDTYYKNTELEFIPSENEFISELKIEIA